MRRRLRASLAVLAMLALVVSSVSMTAAASPTIIKVTPNDVKAGYPSSLDEAGTYWWTDDTRADGGLAFVNGPDTAPNGTGSLQLTTDSTLDNNPSNAKAQLMYYGFAGTPLAEISGMSFWTYRESASTNSAAQYPSLNIAVDFKGDGTSFTTLVWEPIYGYGQEALKNDEWQKWDAIDSPDPAGWWSSKAIPGVCAFECYVSWQTIVDNNPNAKIAGGFGFNIGSGWVGKFTGNADSLSITINGDTTTFNFDPLTGPPTTTQQCFNNGWQQFDNPPFRNQGDCVSYVATQKVNQVMQTVCERIGNPVICQRIPISKQ